MVRSDGYVRETTIKYDDKTVDRITETVQRMKMASKGDPVTYRLEGALGHHQQ